MNKPLTFAVIALTLATVVARAQSPAAGDVQIVTPKLADDILVYRQSLPEERPPLRGWRTPILENAGRKWPFDEPDAGAPPEIRKGADPVAVRLASDGLLPTLAKAIEFIGPARFGKDAAADTETLRSVGLPVDLLQSFYLPAAKDGNGHAIIKHIADRLTSGSSAESLRGELSAAGFRFAKSANGFRLVTESGEEEIGLVRVQLSKGEYWHGIGDGGALDIIRQLSAALPDANFLVSTQRDQTTLLTGLVRLWPGFRPERFTVIAEPMSIGQWAQDNGKPGVIESDTTVKRRVVTLVPRYTSRGDDGSTFIPGESFMADGWAAAGLSVIQSPLIFQGGDLMAVRHPKTGERTLLIGEAEIYRNTAMGLSRDQAIDAFRVEMGVDRCVVLPSVSYHIDYELTVRAVGDELVAFVNDTPGISKSMVLTGVGTLQTAGLLTEDDARSIGSAMTHEHFREAIDLLDRKVFHGARQQGPFPESLARHFSKSLADSGAGHLQRFLLALDLVIAETESAGATPTDPNFAEYVAAIRRRDADRKRLHQQLADLGWRVVGIPSLGEAERSINYVNGIQARGMYLMPAFGGYYDAYDSTAQKAFEQILGPEVRVVPILSAESQRRNGAVHCAASVYPK